MKTNELLTIDKIVEASQPQLIVELMSVGFPSEKISDAILALRDAITIVFRSGLKSNHIQDLVLVLSGVSDNSTWLKKIETEYTNRLTLSLEVDPNQALKASQHIIPFAIGAIGNHLPTSNLNKVGISNLVSFSTTRKSNILELTKTRLIKCIILIVMLLCN